MELVLLDDFGGNDVHRYFHVFVLGWIFHERTKIDILYVHTRFLVIIGGDDVVEEDLGRCDVGSASIFVAIKIDEINADSEAHSIWFFLLGPDGANQACISWSLLDVVFFL